MRIIGTSSNGGSQESDFYSNINKGKGRGGKTSFQGRHKSLHGGHHQHEGQAHGGGRKKLWRKRKSRKSWRSWWKSLRSITK